MALLLPLVLFSESDFFFFFNQLTFWDLLQSVSLPHFYQDLFFPLMLLIPSSILWTLLPAAFLTIRLVLKGRFDFLVWLGSVSWPVFDGGGDGRWLMETQSRDPAAIFQGPWDPVISEVSLSIVTLLFHQPFTSTNNLWAPAVCVTLC